MLHIPDRIIFTRASERIKPYESPEWQANTFAGELLVHTDLISGLSVKEITERYGVSSTVAIIQLEHA